MPQITIPSSSDHVFRCPFALRPGTWVLRFETGIFKGALLWAASAAILQSLFVPVKSRAGPIFHRFPLRVAGTPGANARAAAAPHDDASLPRIFTICKIFRDLRALLVNFFAASKFACDLTNTQSRRGRALFCHTLARGHEMPQKDCPFCAKRSFEGILQKWPKGLTQRTPTLN